MLALLLAAAVAGLSTEVGDFDHDGRPDLARVEPAAQGYRLIVARAAGPVVLVREMRSITNLRLGKAPPGEYATACAKSAGAETSPCDPRRVTLTGETLTFGTEEASAAVARWNGSGFDVIWLSD